MKTGFLKKLLIWPLLILLGLPQLGLARTSNDPKSYQTAYEQAGVFRAWDYTTGSSDVVVAVIDNGFDTFHPDLLGNVWKNTKEIAGNGLDDDKNGYVDDIWGWDFLDNDNNPQPPVSGLTEDERNEGIFNHGTVVAGVIGAVGDNSRDGVGVNWRVKLMNLRVIGNNGFGELAPLASAIRYAVDNGAHVINISMVGDRDQDMIDAINYAHTKGVVVVAAMGNYNGDLDDNLKYPTCTDADTGKTTVLGVSAIGPDRKLAIFSNVGIKCVDLTAPGVGIGSTVRFSPADQLTQSYSDNWQGTSFAAPFVSGAAAMVKSVRPEWKAPQIYNALFSTVHKTPPDDEEDYANMYGKGLIQVHRAVAYAMGLALPPTMFETPSVDTAKPVVTPPPVISASQRTFSVVSPTGELRDGYPGKSEMGGWYERPEAKGVESLAFAGVGRDQKIVTARVKNKNERLITVYNSKWQEENNWVVPVNGPVHIAAFDRDIGFSIAVSPLTPSTQVYWLYTIDGELVESVSQKTKHNGVRIFGDTNGMYAVIANGKVIDLVTYSGGLPLLRHTLAGYTKLPSAVIGDLVGDSQSEIVLGEANEVAIYTLDGSLVRAFSPFGDGRPGVNVALLDADGNGTLDIVTIPISKSNVVRAWTPRAKPVGEWAMPSSITSLFLLPRK